jgi:hypothetical protein
VDLLALGPLGPELALISGQMNEAQERALRELVNATNPLYGHPLDWRIGTALVKLGWAELGFRYAHYRITEAGRRALAEQQIGSALLITR